MFTRNYYLRNVFNLLMFSALFYLSISIVKCINSESFESEKIAYTNIEIPVAEIDLTKNIKTEAIRNIIFNFDFSKLNYNNLVKNISLSVFLTGFIIWGKLLPSGAF